MSHEAEVKLGDFPERSQLRPALTPSPRQTSFAERSRGRSGGVLPADQAGAPPGRDPQTNPNPGRRVSRRRAVSRNEANLRPARRPPTGGFPKRTQIPARASLAV